MNKEELITGMYMFDEDGNEWIDKQTYNCLYEEYIKLQAKINEAIEYIEQQKLHKFQDTIGGLTYKEMKLLDILKGVDKSA